MFWKTLLLTCLLATAAVSEPACWDDFLSWGPRTPIEAHHMSRAFNQILVRQLESQTAPELDWWVRQTQRRCQENLQALSGPAGEPGRAALPQWRKQAERFVQDWLAEQIRLVRLESRVPSEIRLHQGESAGWELPDGAFLLTFDDGPRPSTARVLEVLRKSGVGATFFVLGQRLQEARAEGSLPAYGSCRLASHSFDHAFLPDLSEDMLEREFSMTEDQAERAGVKLDRLFRAPYGARRERELEQMQRHHLRSWLWNVDSQDWQASMQAHPGRIAGRTLALMLLQRRGIVLMHDVQPRTADELQLLLPAMKRAGLRVVEDLESRSTKLSR